MARLIRALLLALALAGAAFPAAAQPGQDLAGLSWLVGTWRGAGTMVGQASQAELIVRPALGGRFLELSYRAGGFEGRAFYRPLGEGRWQGRWFDNRGVSFAIEASAVDRTLTADWGDATTERGRTVYRLGEDGQLHVADSVLLEGRHRPFADHRLTRAD